MMRHYRVRQVAGFFGRYGPFWAAYAVIDGREGRRPVMIARDLDKLMDRIAARITDKRRARRNTSGRRES